MPRTRPHREADAREYKTLRTTFDLNFKLIEEQNPEWADLWPELMGHDIVGPLSQLQGR